MERVQRPLDEAKVHAAAPIVLAGSALEEALRGLRVGCPVAPTGKPGMSSYATALQKGGILTPQDVKDITSWAGQRNQAAHGEFDKLNRDRAQTMVDGINLFTRQKL